MRACVCLSVGLSLSVSVHATTEQLLGPNFMCVRYDYSLEVIDIWPGHNASNKMFTLKDGTDFPKDGQAAGAEVLTEAKLE